ncbi:MAG: cysteine hydrolase [Clostridia bacterium]|nr:cysteine hydrolase [Clostridia bacterium]
MKRTLIVIDMQNDFVTGPLGTEEAKAIVPQIKAKIDAYRSTGDEVIFTRDTHTEDYMSTPEGKHLPVPHCIHNTEGWEVIPELDIPECEHIDKPTFGWPFWTHTESPYENDSDETYFYRDLEEIELVGVCTDICVASNALILKAMYPWAEITVDASCCAGVTPETHKAALTVMKSCQINVINEEN